MGAASAAALAFPFTEGDALALPFADDLFDAACSGFMMRNVIDMRVAFAEQARVVRPGGRVVCLEITRPGARRSSGRCSTSTSFASSRSSAG